MDIDWRGNVAELPAWFDGDWGSLREAAKGYHALPLMGNVDDARSVFKLLIVQYPNKHRGMDRDAVRLNTEATMEAFCKIPGDLLRKAALIWMEGSPRESNKFFGKGFPDCADLQKIIQTDLRDRRTRQYRLTALMKSEGKLRKEKPFIKEGTREDRRAIIEASLKRLAKTPEETKEPKHA